MFKTVYGFCKLCEPIVYDDEKQNCIATEFTMSQDCFIHAILLNKIDVYVLYKCGYV